MKIRSQLQTSSAEYKQNHKHHQGLADELRQRLQVAALGGGERARKQHEKRGKLPVRERIERIIDPGTAFLELGALAAHEVYDDPVPSAGVVSGIGLVHGRECMLVANDATVKGGTYFPLSVKKHLRAQEIALENRLPCVYLVDSGGAFLPKQDEVFPDRDHFGRIFYNQARMSALGIAQIAVVLGPCTAGGAYIPAMSDEAIIVKGNGSVFLAGPPLVKAATGEEVSVEDLGGGDVHTRLSGVCDHYAQDEEEALALCREVVANLGPAPSAPQAKSFDEPLYPASELYGVIPSDPRVPYDVREVIARLVDGSAVSRVQAALCPHPGVWLCPLSMGYPVGVVANNGVLFSESAQKGAHFIQLCGQRGIHHCFFCKILRALWWGANTKTRALPGTGPRW